MNMPQPPTAGGEAELIRRVCGGEREAFCELVHPYERMIYVTAISVLKNPADAEDVAQEAMLKAFTKLASFRGESRFSTWLIQITYNEAKMKLRRGRPNLFESIDDPKEGQDGDYWPRDFADWRPIPSDTLERDEERRALENAIDSLQPAYREVLVLRDVQGFSIEETSTVLGVSKPNIKTRLLRARLMLRDTLAPGLDGSWSRRQNYRKVRPW